MRILMYSNAPWAGSGYGTQTAQLARRIRAAGHDIAIANNYGLQAQGGDWEGIPVLAAGYDGHSRDVILPHADAWQADWILTLYDVWILDRGLFANKRVVSWVPVDAEPAPPGVVAWCKEHLSVAMSQFGQRALAAQGVDARYAPHALDLTVYKPTPSDARDQLKIPADAFVVFINAANKGMPPRKAWGEMLDAFAQFSARHPDAYLLLNTDMDGANGGLNLPHLITALGIDPTRIRMSPQYEYRVGKITTRHVAAFYSASDVLLSTSKGEGFGLAVIEAQACGLPVIVTDWTAQPELVGAGWTVSYQREWHPGHNTWWGTPNITEIVNRLEDSYAARGDEKLREQAIAFAQQYDADRVFETYWLPILAEMEADLQPREKRQVRRAKNRRPKGRAA